MKTCKPAMGYSFAAGTTDGPGAFDFTQGTYNRMLCYVMFNVGILSYLIFIFEYISQ